MDLDHHPALPRGLIQVAGVHDPDEAGLLVRAGVDLIGIPLRLTVNAEDVSEEQAARICRAYPGRCCLITYLDQTAAIADLSAFLGVRHVQLHGEIEPAVLAELKARLPGICLIKSLVIGKGPVAALLETVQACAPAVDAFITDTYDPQTGAEGATGRLHDWEISRRLREASPKPVILAGGLNPDNVAQAIRAVRPFGVDVHTGVEGPDGRKAPQQVARFVEAARRALLDYPRQINP